MVQRRELSDGEKRNKGCGEEKTLYFNLGPLYNIIFHVSAH